MDQRCHSTTKIIEMPYTKISNIIIVNFGSGMTLYNGNNQTIDGINLSKKFYQNIFY